MTQNKGFLTEIEVFFYHKNEVELYLLKCRPFLKLGDNELLAQRKGPINCRNIDF